MLTVYDIIGASLCLLVLWLIFSNVSKKYTSGHRKLIRSAFRFKIIATVLFALITAYYYKGGDSEMFLYAVRDMHEAIFQKAVSIPDILLADRIEDNHPLFYFFQQDNTLYPVSGFMRHSSNFLVPKLGIVPYIVFFKSYLAMCLVFGFFALAGTIRIYKLFLNYFPTMQREIALATLFLPSATYWSSGFLKDSICFGAVGFLLYGLFNCFIRKKKLVASVFWIIASVYLLYIIKVYILLALIPGIGFWLIGELSYKIKNPLLKRVITLASFIIAGVAAFYFVDYLTSDTALSKFNIDNILESSDYSRRIFERRGGEGSSFQISTTNPALLFLNGLVATFFRPFPWEVNSVIVLFSALESLVFFLLIVYLFYKKGFTAPFRNIFSTPLLILCFSFAIIFAVSVGISTTNFGSLSRYKIPCLPFYLMFIFGAYHLTGLAYPAWMERILSFIKRPVVRPQEPTNRLGVAGQQS